MVFAWGVGPADLAFTGQWRRALTTGGVSGAVLVAGVGLYAAFNPYYFFETFTAHLAHTDPERHWLLSQAQDFTLLTCGMIAIAVSGGALILAGRKHRSAEPMDDPTANARYWGSRPWRRSPPCWPARAGILARTAPTTFICCCPRG